jgi:hypothetical protein
MQSPATFTISMTTAEYAKAVSNITSHSIAKVAGNTGSLVNADVSLDWTFDGSANTSVTVTAVHSFRAKIASEEQMQSHIVALLNS